jgi:hypothetical protein
MKALVSSLFVVVGLMYLSAHAQTAPAAPPASAAPAPTVQAGLQAIAQAAASAGPILATLGTLFGAFGLILSGIQQILGVGARSKSPILSKYSGKALAVVQHVAGAPDVKTS